MLFTKALKKRKNMLLIKLSTTKNEENARTYSIHLIKKNIKYTQFNQFFIYCTHNKNERKRIYVWSWNMKFPEYEADSFLARYCHNCTFLQGVSFKQHEQFQTILSWVQFSEPAAKICFLVKFTTIEFLIKLSNTKFWQMFFHNFAIKQ